MTRLRTIPEAHRANCSSVRFPRLLEGQSHGTAPGPVTAIPTLQSVEIVGKTAFVVGETFQLAPSRR